MEKIMVWTLKGTRMYMKGLEQCFCDINVR